MLRLWPKEENEIMPELQQGYMDPCWQRAQAIEIIIDV